MNKTAKTTVMTTLAAVLFFLPLTGCPVNGPNESREFTISQGIPTNGAFTISHVKAAAETQIILEITNVVEGFEFIEWTFGGATISPVQENDPYMWTFVMPAANITVNAIFRAKDAEVFQIARGTHANGGFEISPSEAAAGETVILTAAPAQGFAFYSWNIISGDAGDPVVPTREGSTNVWTFTMPAANVTVNAVFNAATQQTFTVTKGAHVNGEFTIAPSSAVAGTTISLEVVANTGYVFNRWNITGASVAPIRIGNSDAWTFAMPAANITVNAIFNQETPLVDPEDLGPVDFIYAEGWRETFFVTWHALEGAASYNVYFRGGAANDWTRIDDPLIREYEGGFFRADVLGIKAGVYDVRVIPVNSAGAVSPNVAIRPGIEVTAHIRTGFAFANVDNGNWPGAYNMDGTPRPNARVIYVTNDNKNTVQLDIVNDAGRDPVTFTGIANIIEAHSNRAHDTRPLIVRFVGKINAEGFIGLNGDRQLQINRPTARNNAPITLEGVGNDATAFGWGIRTNRARFVEIRNLGFMLRNHNADSIDIDGNNTGPGYVWVHHNDFFYGQAGGGDFQKGDGDLDIRRSSHVTVSFNHFWDTGKTSLLGTQIGETVGFITYHNNHFNHSDGRHPRVRAHQVHMFNNYFNHIAQYAIGAAGGRPSIFAEANYFRRTRNPMLISRQGTDIIGGGAGTFSSEDGGMIKAYNNFMCEWTLQHFRPWSLTNTVEFDAFVVQNRNDMVPDTVVSRQGGHAFSNFDQNLGYVYIALSPQGARLRVLRYAGRFWGGEIGTDIPFAFGPADVGTARERRNPELDAILSGYRSRVVAVQGMDLGAGDGNDDGDNGGGLPPPVGNRTDFNFSVAPFTALSFSATEEVTHGGLTFGPNWGDRTQYTVNIDISGVEPRLTHAVRPGGSGSASARYLIVPLEGPSRITVFASSNNSNATTMTMHSGLGGANIGTFNLPGQVSGHTNINQPVPIYSNTVGAHNIALKPVGNIRLFMIRVELLD